MDKRLLQIINQRQLASVMNQTRWQQLMSRFSALADVDPEVRYKNIDSQQIYGFSQVWWDELLQMAPAIEWLDLNPVKTEYRGRLVAPLITDYSAVIEAVIRQVKVPFTREGHYFRIWGYTDKGINFIE
ncbi:hypothetical protein QE250_08875 [Chromatiaceae bacterium AAb-1]|nr:hypothetical protein [Chromatiaceae bacterium AAb-1]